ncbi:Transketolase [Phytophthora palmivora]|uniref:Transketolase n=1 Tax=Phytophthora palmivora TaxID=4796 RepID=A0A2P4YTP8_9STRA|nr:Transketolase [Phytophthora palmivora]
MTDIKKIRATWESTVNLFLERTLIEEAWGEGEEGREVSVSQFKNKLNAIRKLYRSKRTQMLATGNRGTGSSSDEDETGDYAPVQRMYPAMPSNYLLQRDGNADLADRNDLTCDPLNVRPEYRKVLGNELVALGPLLCDIFSSNPGLTGEDIVESGLKNDNCDGNEDIDSLSSESDSRSEGECSDTPSDARVKAKAAAKL